MKGYYGYIVTMVGLVLSVVLTAFLSENNVVTTESNISTFMFFVALSGFAGGFVSPYHVVKNSIRTALTITLLVLTPLFIATQQTDELLSSDAGALGAVIFLIILLVLIVIVIMAIILLVAFGIVGSLFGRLVFKRDQFPDKQEDFMPNPGYG